MSTEAQALMVRDDSRLTVTFSPEAQAMQNKALELAALCGKVTCAEEQQEAVDAQKELTRVLRLVETDRKAVKEPVLTYGRAIDDAAKKFVAELKEEETRIVMLISNFQALEMAKVRAAQAAENERLSKLEQERQAALAQAKSHDELDKVNAEFDTKQQDERPAPVAPIRVKGQSVREEWDFEILDVWALAKAYPNCVKAPEPRRLEIKSLLDVGIKLPGVKAWKAMKSGVRL